jgi:glycosyltransferase involved in cell wall biosynthesis
MHFIVFSFNRGEFLDNCIASIEYCAPDADITIFDDDSDDLATRQRLQSLAARHRVIYPEPGPGNSKHGGLYANMQSAFERLEPDDVTCFLQDDVQLVRKLSAEDFDAIARYFDTVDNAGFIQPAFLRGCNRLTDQAQIRFDAAAGGYLVDRLNRSAGAWYSDIFVVRARDLRDVGWKFLARESRNELQARERLRQMLYLKNPFAAWLPCPPAWRGKTRTIALRLAHRLSGCGYYPLRYMSDAENELFRQRDARILPVAEDFLDVDGSEPPEPWIYHPLQGRRLLKLLNSAELKIRRALP